MVDSLLELDVSERTELLEETDSVEPCVAELWEEGGAALLEEELSEEYSPEESLLELDVPDLVELLEETDSVEVDERLPKEVSEERSPEDSLLKLDVPGLSGNVGAAVLLENGEIVSGSIRRMQPTLPGCVQNGLRYSGQGLTILILP